MGITPDITHVTFGNRSDGTSYADIALEPPATDVRHILRDEGRDGDIDSYRYVAKETPGRVKWSFPISLGRETGSGIGVGVQFHYTFGSTDWARMEGAPQDPSLVDRASAAVAAAEGLWNELLTTDRWTWGAHQFLGSHLHDHLEFLTQDRQRVRVVLPYLIEHRADVSAAEQVRDYAASPAAQARLAKLLETSGILITSVRIEPTDETMRADATVPEVSVYDMELLSDPATQQRLVELYRQREQNTE